ncbi:MAG: hypothetical protein ACPGUD_12940 [Parashewanella sp.]
MSSIAASNFRLFRPQYNGFSQAKLDKLKSPSASGKTLLDIEGVVRRIINYFSGIHTRKVLMPVMTILHSDGESGDLRACREAMEQFNKVFSAFDRVWNPSITVHHEVIDGIEHECFTLRFYENEVLKTRQLASVPSKNFEENARELQSKLMQRVEKKRLTEARYFEAFQLVSDCFLDPEAALNDFEALKAATTAERVNKHVYSLRANCINPKIRFNALDYDSDSVSAFRAYWMITPTGQIVCLKSGLQVFSGGDHFIPERDVIHLKLKATFSSQANSSCVSVDKLA